MSLIKKNYGALVYLIGVFWSSLSHQQAHTAPPEQTSYGHSCIGPSPGYTCMDYSLILVFFQGLRYCIYNTVIT